MMGSLTQYNDVLVFGLLVLWEWIWIIEIFTIMHCGKSGLRYEVLLVGLYGVVYCYIEL